MGLVGHISYVYGKGCSAAFAAEPQTQQNSPFHIHKRSGPQAVRREQIDATHPSLIRTWNESYAQIKLLLKAVYLHSEGEN